jgi:hypothetical protein
MYNTPILDHFPKCYNALMKGILSLKNVAIALALILSVPVYVVLGYALLTPTETSTEGITRPIKQGDWEVVDGVAKCTRTIPKEDDPDFRRALILIHDRAGIVRDDSSNRNISMCVDIVPADLRSQGAHGQFSFDQSSTRDNLTIYVDESYSKSDMLLTTLLLRHELQHVSNFLWDVESESTTDCYENEAQAVAGEFVTLDVLFNDEERRSLIGRVISYEQGVLTTTPSSAEAYGNVAYLLRLKNQTADLCKSKYDLDTSGYYNCIADNLKTSIDSVIRNNPGYQDQCESQPSTITPDL